MARIPQERPELADLILRIESSRGDLGGHVRKLKRKLDVPSRVRHSVASSPLAWFGGSLGVGFLSSRILRKKRSKERKRGGFFGFLFAALMTLVKPSIKGFLLGEIQRRLKVHTNPETRSRETQLPLSNDPGPGSYS
jgi:hypothetical protein